MPRRATNPMSFDVGSRLAAEGVRAEYDARPRYQRNDYLGWIERAKQPATREKRVAQMIDELRRGGVYMKMDHPPSAK